MEFVKDLQQQVEEEARGSLRTFLGDQEGDRVWIEACKACNLESAGAGLGFTELEAIAQSLKAHRGAEALVGHSLSIQVRTYQMLARARRLEAFLQGGSP